MRVKKFLIITIYKLIFSFINKTKSLTQKEWIHILSNEKWECIRSSGYVGDKKTIQFIREYKHSRNGLHIVVGEYEVVLTLPVQEENDE